MFAAVACPAHGETGGPKAPGDVLPTPPAPISSVELDAETLGGTFYQALWQSSDMEIERNDLPRWSQSDFATTSPGLVSMKSYEADAAGWNTWNAADLAQKRENVAKRIWDQRLMTMGNHGYATLRDRSKAIGSADAAMNSLGSAEVDLSPRPSRSGGATGGNAGSGSPAAAVNEPASEPVQFRYGYIVLADTAFVSLRQTNGFDLSLRRSNFLTAGMSRAGYGGAPTFLSFQKSLGAGLPSPTVTYTVQAPALDLAIAQSISPNADVSLTGGHDFVLDSHRVYFTMAYRF